jgi:hypothetical protein
MTNKGRKQPMQKVRNLKMKNLSADKAKHVKGGPMSHPDRPQEAGRTSLLLPAVQKVRE